MTREWAPGDVALVQNGYGVWNVAICQVALGYNQWVYGVSRSTAPMDSPARPLALIDPEDRAQVEQLASRLRLNGGGHPYATMSAQAAVDDADALQAALRMNIAQPTPPEPTGIGAVVEDAEGQWWTRVRNDDEACAWQRVDGPMVQTTWGLVGAVLVIAQGTQPMADWERDLLRGDA